MTFSAGPDWNPVPLTVRIWLALAPVIGFGVSDVTAGGAAGAFTVRPAEADVPFGLVTLMVQARAVMPALIEVTICVAESVVTARLVEKPGYVAVTVVPATKPLPVRVSDWAAFDPVIGFGLSEEIAGGVGACAPQL